MWSQPELAAVPPLCVVRGGWTAFHVATCDAKTALSAKYLHRRAIHLK